MGEISVGYLNEKGCGVIGEITLSKGKCDVCCKESQIVLEVDFCYITNEEATPYDNICLGCLNLLGNTVEKYT